MDPLIFLILLLVSGIFRLLSGKAKSQKRETDSTPERPEPTFERSGGDTDQERIRRFLEALGQPTSAAPPPPVKPRPVEKLTDRAPQREERSAHGPTTQHSQPGASPNDRSAASAAQGSSAPANHDHAGNKSFQSVYAPAAASGGIPSPGNDRHACSAPSGSRHSGRCICRGNETGAGKRGRSSEAGDRGTSRDARDAAPGNLVTRNPRSATRTVSAGNVN